MRLVGHIANTGLQKCAVKGRGRLGTLTQRGENYFKRSLNKWAVIVWTGFHELRIRHCGLL
jgi:hypothetical protein